MSITEVDGIYCKVNELCLDDNERNQLKAIANRVPIDFPGEIPDGNFVGKITNQLPEWFKIKAEKFLVDGWPMFLKNKGNVIWHTDNHRKCSITIPLNHSNIPTVFESNVELYHNGETYLQNNYVKHKVPPGNEDRYFLQISFTQSYEDIRHLINNTSIT